MATRTSTQSGNFNSTTTWGGNPVPVDGDSFVVANGHIVTIDDDRRVTNGFNDSYVNGKLHITGSGKIKMNGILYIDNNGTHTAFFAEGNANTAGFLRMDPGSLFEIKGTLADQHSIRMTAKGYTTMEIIGTNPNPNTTLALDADNNATSISLTSAADFAIGDWITIYKAERTGKSYLYNNSDEAVWIHDIDYVEDTVYFRKFVSPETTIISVSGSNIIVSDASVMRIGYQVIFGTDANRNIKTITNIDYNNNIITLDSSVSGNVINQTMYRTGLDKGHLAGDDVLRIAAVLTEDANQGTNTIVVNNTNGFSVGDLILITMNDPNYSNANNWDLVMDYTITDINTSTKTITITAGYANPTITTLHKNFKAGVGGLVVNLTRDTKLSPPEGTTYGTNNVGFVYWDYVGSPTYYRRIKIKNVEIKFGTSNASQYYGALGGRGHQSYDLTSNGQYTFEVDGNSVYPTYRTSYLFGYFWEHHQCNIRNNVLYNSSSGWSLGRYGNNMGVYNNIIARSLYGMYIEGHYEPVAATAYNYVIRSQYAYSLNQSYEPKAEIANNYAIFILDYPISFGYSNGPVLVKNFYMDSFARWPYADRCNKIKFINCYFGNSWDFTNYKTGGRLADGVDFVDGGSDRVERRAADTNLMMSLGHNFQYQKAVLWTRRAMRFYDENENAWRIYPDRNDGGYAGFSNDIYVPANSKVFIKASVKTYTGNTNYPYLYITSDTDSNYGGRYMNNTDLVLNPLSDSSIITESTGFIYTSRFSSSANVYEDKTLTIPVLPFDYYLTVGIGCNGSTGTSYGWWEKDLDISIENPIPFYSSTNNIHHLTTRIPVTIKSTINELKTILGG